MSTTATSTTIIAPPLPDAPYRGIEQFRFTDQKIFAARSEEIWTLQSNVTLYRASLLYGASGTGKSSLINAGFLPQALKENYVADRLRVQPIPNREIKVERMRMSARDEEAAYLPSNFDDSGTNSSPETMELSVASFRQRLEQFRPAPNAPLSNSVRRPLLIFDQFEEFVTLFEEAHRVGTIGDNSEGVHAAKTSQRQILKMLVEIIQDETLPVKLIFAFREDYLAKLSLLFDYCPELLDQAQRLRPPKLEILPQIIRAPFATAELRAHFHQRADGSGSEISEELAKEIATELERRSEDDTANLTELQIVCQRLWQAPNAEQLFRKDGIAGLLKSYGSDVFANLSPELREVAVVLLSHMITGSNTRNIISEEDILSRTGECNFGPSQCSEALAALSRSQIVRREPRHSIYFYEITSEYLVPWIKEKVAQNKLAEEQRRAEAERKKLEQERTQALEKFVSERRRARVMSRLLAVLGLLTVVVAVLLGWGLNQYRKLHAADLKTQEQKQELERIQKAIRLVNSQNQDEVLAGIREIDVLIKENKLSSDLKSLLINPASNSQYEQVRLEADKVLAQAAQTDQKLAQSIDKSAQQLQQLPPRFFIHIADDSQRPQAQRLAAYLKKQGYLVPGIQNVGDKGVTHNQLRYFRDTGTPSWQEIIAVLNKGDAGTWIANRVRGYDTKVADGQFELWLATPDKPAQSTTEQSSNSTEPCELLVRFRDENNSVIGYGWAPDTLRISNSKGKELDTKNSSATRDGSLKFSVPKDTYTVYAVTKGYEPATKAVSVTCEGGSAVTLTLKKAAAKPQAR